MKEVSTLKVHDPFFVELRALFASVKLYEKKKLVYNYKALVMEGLDLMLISRYLVLEVLTFMSGLL